MIYEKIDLYKYVNNFVKYKNVESQLVYGEKELINNPYITIAIPTYNRPTLLKEAIDSALNQIKPNCEFEVIVVDNGVKTDFESETEKLIRSYSDNRLLYYKNEKNLGMLGNWNRCIELARGKWVAFLHDDDLLKPDYCKKITHLVDKKPDIGALVVSAETIGVHQEGQKEDVFILKKLIKKIMQKHERLKLVRIRSLDCQLWNFNIYGAPTCGTLLNKELVIKEGGFNEKFFPSSDMFFFFKFNQRYKIYKILDIMGSYRILENESLNINTIRGFIIDAANFREFNRNHNLIGLILNMLFRYEQHVTFFNGALNLDKSSSIKPEEFNYICEYKIRPVRLFIYRKIRTIYWRIKKINAIIFG